MIVELSDRSQISEVRRAAEGMAVANGFDEDQRGRFALIATELGTNLIKHARSGQISLGGYDDSSGIGLEILAFDKGAGIADLDRAMEDGSSSRGTMGAGLGAIRRQADVFDIYSRPEQGTAVVARIAKSPPRRDRQDKSILIGAVTLPYRGETVSGDDWAFGMSGAGPVLLMADGSGHGIHAEAAAKAAVAAFHDNVSRSCVGLLTAIHDALKPTRGGAVAVACVEPGQNLVRYAGIGNIAGAVINNGEIRRMVSNNGIAGHVASTIRDFTYPYEGSATVVLHSDGLSNGYNLSNYPGLAFRHPSLIAAILFRDFARLRDDAAIVAMRM